MEKTLNEMDMKNLSINQLVKQSLISYYFFLFKKKIAE